MKSNAWVKWDQSEQEGERKTAKQAGSVCDFKLSIRRPCTVDTDGPEVTLTQREKENKSTSENTKASFSSVGFSFQNAV